MRGESIEARGRTSEEAIRLALEQLGATRDEVEVEVLVEGRPGVFGVGAQEAMVRVTVLSEEEEYEEPEPSRVPEVTNEDAEMARETLERMLDLLDFPNVVTVRGLQRDREITTIRLDVEGDDAGLIIGRRGETLANLQFLLNACLGRQLPRDTRIVIDIEHYRDRREESLRAIALQAADRARRERRPVALQPMPANERRIIHLALQSNRYVSTESTGEGADRRVVISPRSIAPPRRSAYGYPRGLRG